MKKIKFTKIGIFIVSLIGSFNIVNLNVSADNAVKIENSQDKKLNKDQNNGYIDPRYKVMDEEDKTGYFLNKKFVNSVEKGNIKIIYV